MQNLNIQEVTSIIFQFFNGRYIKNFILNKAILEGYHTLLTIGRYPICYINIEMDPILVDVNVHPTKLEVRLSKEDQLYDLIVEKLERHSMIEF